jgi:AcrR family transcriptional regulator
MGRWEPDAQRRLREAALELFEEQGYEHTTVAEIAERAGVTARTFFRHYADKREVLFAGSALLQQRLVDALAAVDPATPFDAAATAVEQAFDGLGVTRAAARRRAAVIASTAELRERELIKMASLADALADGLRQQGVADTDAVLAADSAVTAMRIAFARWTGARRGPSLSDEYRSTVSALRSVTAAHL